MIRTFILLTVVAFVQVLTINAQIISGDTLIITEGTTVIPANAYKNNKSFRWVYFPSSLERIGESSFSGCDSLVEIVIPKEVFVGKYAFQKCKGLRYVEFQDKVKVDSFAFSYCTAIDSIVLGENDSLGQFTFLDITPIREVYIPSSTHVGGPGIPSFKTIYGGSMESFFYNLNYYHRGTMLYVNGEKMGNEIVVPDYVELNSEKICSLTQNFSTLTVKPQLLNVLENVCTVDTLNFLGDFAQYNDMPIRARVIFFNGKRLGGIVPEGIDSLGYEASDILVNDDTKEKIVLPSSLKYIEYVVGNKDKTLNIISFAEYPPLLKDNFYMVSNSVNLYVPCESVEAYKNDKMWGNAKSIKCLSDTTEISLPVNIDTSATDTTAIDTVVHVHDFTYGDCTCGVVDSVEQHWLDISTADELYQFANLVNEGHKWLNGRLLEDIVLNDTIIHRPVEYNRGREIFGDTTILNKWTPIREFSATFEGNNHVIKGLYHERWEDGDPWGHYWDGPWGFISSMKNGTLRNIYFEDAFVYNNWEGDVGICGVAINSFFENCHVSGYFGTIYGSAAGLVGTSKSCKFELCSNAAKVFGGIYGAGITNGSSSVNKCWNSGNVSCDGYSAGGIATHMSKDCYVSNCYNTGNVVNNGKWEWQTRDAGGICAGGTIGVRILDCYNVGDVSSINIAGTIAPLDLYVTNVEEHGDTSIININGPIIHNCYALEGSVKSGESFDNNQSELHFMTEEQFMNGEVCYRLNHGVTDGSQAFYQDIKDTRVRSGNASTDKYPTLDSNRMTVDYDGTSYYGFRSESVDMEEFSAEDGIIIQTYCDGMSLTNVKGLVRLFDVSGRLLFLKDVTSEQTLIIPAQGNGVYILQVNDCRYKIVIR